jgi:class 3 adenylate cyclase
MAGDVADPLKTRRKEVTVVFLDLRGFTLFSDGSEPEEVMSLLRDYHAVMGRTIDEHGGTLEQFAGDGLMVIFNDPVAVENPVACAVNMATAMQARFRHLTVDWLKRGHEIGLGIGIAHGYATIGAIGYEARIGYGVVGRVSNLAARLCAEAKSGQILISQSAYALVEGSIPVKQEGLLSLKGFVRPVLAYSVRTRLK